MFYEYNSALVHKYKYHSTIYVKLKDVGKVDDAENSP